MLTQFGFIKFVFEKYKRRTALLALSIIFAAVLELLLVSFFYYLTNILLGNNETTINFLVLQVEKQNFSWWFLFIAISATFARVCIIVFQANNIAVIGNGLVTELYKTLILTPLIEFKEKPDSEIISLLTTKSQHSIDNIILQITQIFSAITISFGILTALLLIDAQTTIVVVCGLFVTYFVIMHLSKFKLSKASKELSLAHDTKNNQLLNTLCNVEAIMAYGEFKKNINAFAFTDANLRNSQKIIAIFGTAPRFVIEGLLIVLTALPLLFFTSENNLALIDIAFIGAFLVGAVRLLPLINQIYAGLNSIRGSEHVARDIMKIIKRKNQRYISSLLSPDTSNLLIKGVGLQISIGKLKINYPDFFLHEGETLAFVGRSGSGKSKLLHAILGLIDVNTGALANACYNPKTGQLTGVGYASQQPVILTASVPHIVAEGCEFIQSKIDQILKIMCLNDELFEGKTIGERGALLSGGQLQRLALCNALYRSSHLLIMDEPTSALNGLLSKKIMRNIKNYCGQKNIAIICVTHDLEVAKMFDKLIEIK